MFTSRKDVKQSYFGGHVCKGLKLILKLEASRRMYVYENSEENIFCFCRIHCYLFQSLIKEYPAGLEIVRPLNQQHSIINKYT